MGPTRSIRSPTTLAVAHSATNRTNRNKFSKSKSSFIWRMTTFYNPASEVI